MSKARGNSPGSQTASATADLSRFAGEWVHVRFHLAVPAEYLSQFDLETSRGWFIEGMQVTGTGSNGTVVLHQASRGFPQYEMHAAAAIGRTAVFSEKNCWQLGVDGWSLAMPCSTPYGATVLVTDPVKLDAYQAPVLNLEHSGMYGPPKCRYYISFGLFDLEYQVRQPGQPWPLGWQPFHPNAGPGQNWRPGDGDTRIDPDTREPAGHPFQRPGGVSCSPATPGADWDHQLNSFDLTGIAPSGANVEARFRIHAWLESRLRASTPHYEEPGEIGQFKVHGFAIMDGRHVIDVGAGEIQTAQDDRARLESAAPQLARLLAPGDELILGPDLATITVPVQNRGLATVDALVGLEGYHLETGEALDVTWTIVEDGVHIPTLNAAARVEVASDTTEDVTFQLDLVDARPGTYRLSTRVDALDGLDTNPGNDRSSRLLRVIPFRDIHIDLGATTVQPYAGPPGASRTIEAVVVNQGNVLERAVEVRAQVVRMTALSQFEPLDGTLAAGALNPQAVRLEPRGSDLQALTWVLDDTDFLGGAREHLHPGERYAIKLDIAPRADSVLGWWPGMKGTPVPISSDGSGLADVSIAANPACGCLLIPFRVEEVLWESDLSAQNSTSLVPQAFPASVPGATDWHAETLVDGIVVEGRSDLPGFRLAAAADAFRGASSGPAFVLPPYDGREGVEQTLTSPPLPGHLIREDSRAIVDLRYGFASDLPGELVLEQRTFRAGQWTEWGPADATRASRIAVVLAPDFPFVAPSLDMTLAESYNFTQMRTRGVPPPPFYEDPLGRDYITTVAERMAEDPDTTALAPSCGLGARRCTWSPPWQQRSQEDALWLEALNDLLTQWTALNGAGSVSLFTTPNPDLGVGTMGAHGLEYTIQGPAGSTSWPIQSLDALGNSLDTFGGILLVGGNSTQQFAAMSPTLVKLAHGDRDLANLAPDAVSAGHHDALFEILRTAPSAGTRVIGALGPAVATLGLSGIAPEAKVAMWQTHAQMPFAAIEGLPLKLACTGAQEEHGSDAYHVPEDYASESPLDPCLKKIDYSTDPETPYVDYGTLHNYQWLTARDALSYALRDFAVPSATHEIFVAASATPGRCDSPEHPLRTTSGPALAPVTHCWLFRSNEAVQVGDMAIITASDPSTATISQWVRDIQGALADASGELPPTGDDWARIPAGLSTPVAGRYLQAEGAEAFAAEMVQFRLRATATGSGHAAVAVDRLALLGTPRADGVAVDFVTPRLGEAFEPGGSMPIRLALSNRGLNPSPGTTVTVSGNQIVRPSDTCQLGVLPTATVPVAPMGAGEVRFVDVVPAWNGGAFPRSLNCATPAHEQDLLIHLQAALTPWSQDPDRRDDTAALHAVGKRATDIRVLDAALLPGDAVAGEDTRQRVAITLQNRGTQLEAVAVRASIHPGDPSPCWQTFTNGAGFQEGDMLACDLQGNVAYEIPVGNGAITASVPKGAQQTIHVPVDMPALPVGSYVLKVRGEVFDLSAGQRPVFSMQESFHVRAGATAHEALLLHPPSGGLSVTSQGASGLEALSSQPLGRGWHPSGFYTTGTGNHDGRYGPDAATRSDGRTLSHGWRVADCMHCPEGFERVIEWTRDPTPSYRPGIDPPEWPQEGGNSPDARGFGDFGPDRLIWNPRDPSDRADRGAEGPYLSLAGYDEPRLTLLANLDAPEYTALRVEMQLAHRISCWENQGQPPPATPGTNCPGDGWEWPQAWHPLVDGSLPATRRAISVNDTGQRPAGQGLGDQPDWLRMQPSNPLAAGPAIWGPQTGRHAEAAGWQVLQFPIDVHNATLRAYCESVARPAGPTPSVLNEHVTAERDLCLYAHAMGNYGHGPTGVETFAARPVRFRLSAASYGGDGGLASFAIASIGLGEHGLATVGPETISYSMLDHDTLRIPVRIANQGAAPDMVSVNAMATPGREGILLGQDGSVRLGLSPVLADGAESLQLRLGPGESRKVWVEVNTGIFQHATPGTARSFPFVVAATSLLDPSARTEVLMDGQAVVRAWPNLVAQSLVLGDQAGPAPYAGPVFEPVRPIATFRNTGQAAFTLPSIPVQLLAQAIDAGTGEPLGPPVVLQTKHVAGPIPAYRVAAADVVVAFDEWIPQEVGAYTLIARINAGPGALGAELDKADNEIPRSALIGPVRAADLHVTDVWAEEFSSGCSGIRADQILAGHAYCVVAEIQNHGRAGALNPRVHFLLEGGAPFSQGEQPLASLVPDGVFPGRTDAEIPTVVIRSAARVLGDRPTGTWTIGAEVLSDSVFPNFDEKYRELTLDVVRHEISVELEASIIDFASGRGDLSVAVMNKGNVQARPVFEVTADAPIVATWPSLPMLQPGESWNGRIDLFAQAQVPGRVIVDAHMQQDPLARMRVESVARDAVDAPPSVKAMTSIGQTGHRDLTLIFDDPAGPSGWRVTGAAGPLGLASQTIAPGPQPEVWVLAATVPHDTPAGTHAGRIHFEHAATDIAIDVPLQVLPTASLAVALDAPPHAVTGRPVPATLHVENLGNQHLVADIEVHATGAIVAVDQAVRVAPGATVAVPMSITATAERAFGDVVVTYWNGTARQSITASFTVAATPFTATLVSMDAPSAVTRGGEVVLEMRVSNPGPTRAHGEALVVVNGVIVASSPFVAEPGEELPVRFALRSSAKDMAVIAFIRPAGSDLEPGDPAFVGIGAAASQMIDVQSHDRAIPAPGGLVLVGLLALALRRRRP